jgi:hypothetical protein
MYSDVSDIFTEATNKDPASTDQEEASTEDPNSSHQNQDSSLEIPGVALPNNNDDIDDEELPHSIPGGRSIAHNILNNQHRPFLSIDIEMGCDIAGIIQLLAKITYIRLVLVGLKLANDKAEDVRRSTETLNKYVKPECAPEYLAQSSIDVDGILQLDARITGAEGMRTVWPQYLLWVSEHTLPTETIILVAWNGGACDLKWLWQLTEAPKSQYLWPSNIRYFVDPCRVITKYKSCQLNKSKSKTCVFALGINKNFGCHDFQIVLAIDLVNYSISCEWDGVSKERLSFMPKGHLVPSECNKCFFCVKGLTNGIIRPP